MFTGIIAEVGRIGKVVRGQIQRVTIESRLRFKIGDSVAVDGVCLTVVDLAPSSFTVEISQDTGKRTTLGALKTGDLVNLEPPLKVGDYLSGHFVTGHIDAVTRIVARRRYGNEYHYHFQIPKGGEDYIIPLGSVAIDGISLTIKEIRGQIFTVTIIPETMKRTTLGAKRRGDRVNIEYDLIARYLRRWTLRS
ncbi:riboflavin synthase [candidate division WOR-3 bacterium]|uniref:Riboflavin synthase n=1 Tax=candidate division WOR-3 bacterium TaxID=2052148 RepID=A0A660SF70_UNCW3|nr:MAG: riboflavin synthase [candidate division WOR-3 bacterium]